MQPQTIEQRVERLENRMTALEQLPERLETAVTQLSQQIQGVRQKLIERSDEIMTHVRTLHEDMIERLKIIGEHCCPNWTRPTADVG